VKVRSWCLVGCTRNCSGSVRLLLEHLVKHAQLMHFIAAVACVFVCVCVCVRVFGVDAFFAL